MALDIGEIAHDLQLPVAGVERTVQLLDEGNTVPFITRFRKDQTGGFDEQQIRCIQKTVERRRLLLERKRTILRSMESQGTLTDELRQSVESTKSPRRLEDLYLPFKVKKQSLATQARDRGLAPLAEELMEALPQANDLEQRASEFIVPLKDLSNLADVMHGVGHLVVERFAETAELRGRLRRELWKTAKIVCTRVEPEPRAEKASAEKSDQPEEAAANLASAERATPKPNTIATPPATDLAADTPPAQEAASAPAEEMQAPADSISQATADDTATNDDAAVNEIVAAAEISPAENVLPTDAAASVSADIAASAEKTPPPEALATADETTATNETVAANEAAGLAATTSSSDAAAPAIPPSQESPSQESPSQKPASQKPAAKKANAAARKKKKKKSKKEKSDQAFKDYFDFEEKIAGLPPHRILAINRGERARAIRVKLQYDFDALLADAENTLIASGHPHADFLKSCVRDALSRFILPSLEREIRRELTEKAESQAVEVFAQNLRKLLLQPPVRDRVILAIDPGFRSGCPVAVVGPFGNILALERIHVVGGEHRRQASRAKLVSLVREHNATAIAIGNGAASRAAEHLVSDVLGEELKELDVSYVFVNEAGTSVYAASSQGREELPKLDAAQRSAVSLARRLLDPLSELVKVSPANIGVGMYQHDIKAKHLRDSLDAVVESCVNYVGVDVNTASPALLRYVSGLNQLTARHVFEYRQTHGPFRNREQLLEVPGLGDASFLQSAGFLKITGGEQPLDATWIHPESYEAARKVLGKMELTEQEFVNILPRSTTPQQEVTPPQQEVTPPPEVTPPQQEVTPTCVSEAGEAAPSHAAKEADAESSGEVGASDETTSQDEIAPPAAQTPANSAAPSVPDGETPVANEASKGAASVLLSQRLGELDIAASAKELGLGELSLRELLNALSKPGRDPRDELPPPLFRRGVMKIEDLQPGMQLTGVVLNVVDFGVFVDIGVSDSGLVHISRLANRYVSDPHEIVSVGQHLTTWVVEVDMQRRRVSLTAIDPAAKKEPASRPRSKQTDQRASRPKQSKRRDQRHERKSGSGGQSAKKVRTYGSRKKAVKAPPITEQMKEGKAPMRTFGDLQQFFKQEDSPKDGGDKT